MKLVHTDWSGADIAAVAEVDALTAQLKAQTGEEAVAGCLSAAAALVEHAAFEMAQTKTANHVAQMIQLAADLERTAQRYTRES